MTNEEIFFKEFNQMMQQLKGYNGYKDLSEIPLPSTLQLTGALNHDRVRITGINDEYYKALNDTEAMLWDKGALNRRKFDHRGEFMKDKQGNFLLEDVVVPQKCLAIVSDVKLGVPNGYSNKEGFTYVDYIQKDSLVKYIYIVPRKYLYKIKLTALVLSWYRLRSYYSGIQVSLTNGHILYMYVIPYRKSLTQRARVLTCKDSVDYTAETDAILNYWVSNKIMFNPKDCIMSEYVRGRENMAFMLIDGVIEDYTPYDLSKSLDSAESAEELAQSGDFDYTSSGDNNSDDSINWGNDD